MIESPFIKYAYPEFPYPLPPNHLYPPLILDGSINLELDSSCDLTTTTTPRAALDALIYSPDRIKEVHHNYLHAGANVLTTANFSVCPYFLSRFDHSANWHRPGSAWTYGSTDDFRSYWVMESDVNTVSDLSAIAASLAAASEPLDAPALPEPAPTLSDPASLTLASLASLADPPRPLDPPTTPRPAGAPDPRLVASLAVCLPPTPLKGLYRSPRIDCLVSTPLTRMFELSALCGRLAREAVSEHQQGLRGRPQREADDYAHAPSQQDAAGAEEEARAPCWEADSDQPPSARFLRWCRERKTVTGCLAPMFGPDEALLKAEYQAFEVNGRPSPLLETLWALGEYADGYVLNDGKVTNAYDANPALQPPFRTLRVARARDAPGKRAGCSTLSQPPEPATGPDGTAITPPLKSRAELSASLYRGVAMALHPYVDAFLCESLSNIKTAETVAKAAMSTERNVYVSFQLSADDYGVPRLLSCETLAQAVDRLLHVLPRFVSGYSVNCSSPAIITAALPLLRSITQKPIGAYAKLPYSVQPDRRRPGLAGQGRRFEHDQASTASPLIKRDNMLESLGRQMQQREDAKAAAAAGPEVAASDAAASAASASTEAAFSALLGGEVTLDRLGRLHDAQQLQQQRQQAPAVDLASPAPASSDPHSDGGHAAIPASRVAAQDDHELLLGDRLDLEGDCQDCFADHGEPVKGSITAKTLASDAAAECEESRPSGDYTTTMVLASQSALSNVQKRNRAAQLVSRIMSAKEADLPEAYAELAAFWSSDLGADVVGGCCGVSSVHVRKISEKLEQQYAKKIQRWYKRNGLE